MKLLPYRKIVLQTSLTKDQCRETLRNNMVVGSPDSFVFSNPHNLNLVGNISGDTFKVRRIIDGRNLVPIAYGQFTNVSGGTEMLLKFRMDDYTLIITILWLSGILYISIAAATSVISNDGVSSGNACLPIGMFIVGMLVTNISFSVEYKKLETLLKQIFEISN